MRLPRHRQRGPPIPVHHQVLQKTFQMNLLPLHSQSTQANLDRIQAYEPGGICYELQMAAYKNGKLDRAPEPPPPEMAGMIFGNFKNGEQARMVTWNEVME